MIAAFSLDDDLDSVLKLLQKYAAVAMSFADACLVRMAETLPDPVILTTDSDFRTYRRHSRQMVPCVMPSPIVWARARITVQLFNSALQFACRDFRVFLLCNKPLAGRRICWISRSRASTASRTA